METNIQLVDGLSEDLTSALLKICGLHLKVESMDGQQSFLTTIQQKGTNIQPECCEKLDDSYQKVRSRGNSPRDIQANIWIDCICAHDLECILKTLSYLQKMLNELTFVQKTQMLFSLYVLKKEMFVMVVKPMINGSKLRTITFTKQKIKDCNE